MAGADPISGVAAAIGSTIGGVFSWLSEKERSWQLTETIDATERQTIANKQMEAQRLQGTQLLAKILLPTLIIGAGAVLAFMYAPSRPKNHKTKGKKDAEKPAN